MLKFPSGWAEPGSGAARNPVMVSMARTTPQVNRLWCIALLLRGGPVDITLELFQRPVGDVGIEGMKIGIRRQGALQIFPGPIGLAEVVINHPGVKEEARILGLH